MKAEELRIGNYIYKSLKSGNGRIIEEKAGCHDIVRIFEGIGSLDYSPILLNESWLIKFGFTKTTEQIFKEKIVCYELFYNGEAIFFTLDNEIEVMFSYYENRKMKYVHELQNAYFSLTGQELHTGGGGLKTYR